MKSFTKKLSLMVFSLVIAVTCILSPVSSVVAMASPLKTADNANLTFASWGDTQISYLLSGRKDNVAGATADLRNAQDNLDALVLVGDITENATDQEYTAMYDYLADAKVDYYITATGNHDVRLNSYSVSEAKFVNFTNALNSNKGNSLTVDKMYYSYTIKGYKFIVMGTEETQLEEAVISQNQLDWLDSELAASTKKGQPVFVILHQVLKDTHGLPDTWGSSISTAGTVGKQSDKIKNILNKYENVIMISGHLHTGFGEYSYEKIGNFHSVNVPSIGVNNDMGSYNENGLGYITEVYDNKVVFRARNFIEGTYISKYDITINLNKVKKITISQDNYVYDGKAKKPTVKLYGFDGKLINSKNYTVTYPTGRKNVGTYKIKITFKNDLSGAKTVYKSFTISPKATSITSLKSSSAKKITVKWNKRSTQTTGYQIQYSTSSKFTNSKTTTVASYNTTSKTLTGLKSGKKYYVRVRTYKTVNGKKYYSNWSSAKSVKVK